MNGHRESFIHVTVHYITLHYITGDGAGGQGGPPGCHLHAPRLQGGRQVCLVYSIYFYLSFPYFFECQRKIVWSIKVSSIKYRECPWHWSDIFAVFPPARKIRLFPWSSRTAQVHCHVSTQHSSRSEQLPRSLDFCNHFGAKLSSRIGNHAIRAIYSLLSLT